MRAEIEIEEEGISIAQNKPTIITDIDLTMLNTV